jgi:hypothetical protein
MGLLCYTACGDLDGLIFARDAGGHLSYSKIRGPGKN